MSNIAIPHDVSVNGQFVTKRKKEKQKLEKKIRNEIKKGWKRLTIDKRLTSFELSQSSLSLPPDETQ